MGHIFEIGGGNRTGIRYIILCISVLLFACITPGQGINNLMGCDGREKNFCPPAAVRHSIISKFGKGRNFLMGRSDTVYHIQIPAEEICKGTVFFQGIGLVNIKTHDIYSIDHPGYLSRYSAPLLNLSVLNAYSRLWIFFSVLK